MRWLSEHSQMLWIIIGGLSAVASWLNANLPKDVSGYVKRPTSWPLFYLRMVIDLLALVPQPGKAGVLGPINLPGMLSMNTPKRPEGVIEQPSEHK
jgi:hypothetical protein